MKILIVTSTYPRWSDDNTVYFVHDFAAELVDQGHRVRVIAPHYPGARVKECLDGIDVRRFRYFWPASGQTVCYDGGALGNVKKGLLNKIKAPLLVACEQLSVLWHCQSFKPDVINSHWLIPQGLTASVASNLLGIPHVATIHGSDVFSLKSRFWVMLKRFVIKSSSRVTANSSATERVALEISGKGAQHITCIPTGIQPLPELSQADIQLFRLQVSAAENERLCLFVGRLSEEKGVGDLISAVGLLRQRQDNLRLLIVGDGHDRKRFEKLVSDLNLNQVVRFEGWKSKDDVYRYFSACDVFIGPSKQGENGSIEAQGLTFAEAMLAGCGVVGTNIGGIPDLVVPGETGWLAEPGDVEDLASVIECALAEPEKYRQAARERVSKHYLVQATTRRFLEVFEQACI